MHSLLLTIAGIVALNLTMVPAAGTENDKRREAVLVTARAVSSDQVSRWKQEGVAAVVVMLDDAEQKPALQQAANAVRDQGLDLYYWIEVGRNPTMAREHPRWMASLGSHDDWRQRFPSVRAPDKGEVAKAWPWVPIRYREAYDAHLARIERLLVSAPEGYRGVLLNDLQGGPASCGCGNLQCRWATDYGVPSTGTMLKETEVAAHFVAQVCKAHRGKEIVPVWTTECEQEDLPLTKLPKGSWSTGYCGTVPCLDYCRKRFGEQWAALQADQRAPTGLLLLHREFQRDRSEYGSPTAWLTAAVATVRKQGPKGLPPRSLWLVIQGYDLPSGEENLVRRAAARLDAGMILVARTRIDQSYEPRIVRVND
jgi:hypothetical protein